MLLMLIVTKTNLMRSKINSCFSYIRLFCYCVEIITQFMVCGANLNLFSNLVEQVSDKSSERANATPKKRDSGSAEGGERGKCRTDICRKPLTAEINLNQDSRHLSGTARSHRWFIWVLFGSDFTHFQLFKINYSYFFSKTSRIQVKKSLYNQKARALQYFLGEILLINSIVVWVLQTKATSLREWLSGDGEGHGTRCSSSSPSIGKYEWRFELK